MFTVDPQTQKALDDLSSSYALTHRTGVDPHGTQVLCSLYDKVTGARWVEDVEGGMELEAVQNAVKVAQNSERPRTPSQTLQERNALAEENAKLKDALAKARSTIASGGKSTTAKIEKAN